MTLNLPSVPGSIVHGSIKPTDVVAKLDRTLKVPKSTTRFQAFGYFPHTFAANALRALSGLELYSSYSQIMMSIHF